MEDRELLPVVESLLFVSGEPISLERFGGILEGMDKGRILNILSSLRDQYDQNGHGLQLVEVAGGYQLVTRQECAPWIKRLEKVKSAMRLSKPALETLAIIAYKQPIIRTEVEQVRGVDSMGVIKTLLERRLIKMNGRRDGVGRPMVYGTTKEFLMYFGLRGLADLPTLSDFQEIVRTEGEDHQETEPKNGQGIEDSQSVDPLPDSPSEETGEELADQKEEIALETHVPT